ncbi:MAG: flagellar M-ring protein FliF [Myxococcota bacterium]
MNDLIVQVRTFIGSLTGSQRAALAAALVTCFLAIGGVVWWSSVESYDLVTTGNAEDLRRAASKLDEAGVPYRINSAGTGIEVPTAHRGEAFVTAASAGLGNWQEILGAIDMGTSPSIEREYRTRALEAELEKTLNSLDAVEGSRVHIVPLDRITFIGRDKQASASIKVQTASPGALDRGQIKGIVQLIAGAVHGLNAEDVTLVDTDGTLLHPDSDSASTPGGANIDEMRAMREAVFQNNLKNAAERILGSRDAIWASVSVELNASAIQRTSDTYDPEGSVLASEELREETSRDQGRPAGVPGAETNLPENAVGGGGAETETFENTLNYVNSMTHQIETIMPGTVKRVMTSVAVDMAALKPLLSDTVTEEQLRQDLQKVITTAVAYDQTRGDNLTIEFIEFAPLAEAEDGGFDLSTLTYSVEGIMPSLVALLAITLFFLFVARPIVSKITSIVVVRPVTVEEEKRGPPSVNLTADELLERVKYSLNHEMETLDPDELNALVGKFMDSSTTVLRRWMKKAS